jgi:hypothetical protein
VATFNLNGKASIWWEDLKNVKGIHEEDLSWERFEKYFRKKYRKNISTKRLKNSMNLSWGNSP